MTFVFHLFGLWHVRLFVSREFSLSGKVFLTNRTLMMSFVLCCFYVVLFLMFFQTSLTNTFFVTYPALDQMMFLKQMRIEAIFVVKDDSTSFTCAPPVLSVNVLFKHRFCSIPNASLGYLTLDISLV